MLMIFYLSPALDVSLAKVILRFARIDVSIAEGILMFIWGQVQHKHVEELCVSPSLMAVLPG